MLKLGWKHELNSVGKLETIVHALFVFTAHLQNKTFTRILNMFNFFLWLIYLQSIINILNQRHGQLIPCIWRGINSLKFIERTKIYCWAWRRTKHLCVAGIIYSNVDSNLHWAAFNSLSRTESQLQQK